MEYPVAEKALEKWSRERLELMDTAGTAAHVRFRYGGSTCTNGGTPFEAHLHLQFDRVSRSIEAAWIEIPEEGAAGSMCAARTNRAAFLDRLLRPASICGRTLEEAITRDVPVNYAGCFCADPMVNEKWRLALSTVHFALEKRYL